MHAYTKRLLDLLGPQDPFSVLEGTGARLSDLWSRIGTSRLDASFAPGKWTARAIFAHLSDAEIAMGFRIRQVLAGQAIQAFDQDAWARGYGSADAAAARSARDSLRRWNLTLFWSLSLDQLSLSALHPERGQESVDRMIRMLAGHDLNHLAQLETIASGADGSGSAASSSRSA